MAFTSITVTGTYKDPQNNPLAGSVTFTLSQVMDDDVNIICPVGKTVALDGSGHFSITLDANNDPTTNPTGAYYTVQESVPGGRAFNLILDYLSPGGTVDLSRVSTGATPPTTMTPPFIVGLLANRPAAGSFQAGYGYFATDDNGGTLYVASAGVWVQATPGFATLASLSPSQTLTTGTNWDINPTSTWTDIDPNGGFGARPSDIVRPASVGQVIECYADFFVGTAAGGVFLDWWSIVSAVAINKSKPTLTTGGPASMLLPGSLAWQVASRALFTVQAGDIQGGVVRLRPRQYGAGPTHRTIFASAGFAVITEGRGPF